jgi:hypothetical protein
MGFFSFLKLTFIIGAPFENHWLRAYKHSLELKFVRLVLATGLKVNLFLLLF